MEIEVSEVIDRRPEVIFQFVAVEQVQNHPRWDPTIQLEQETDGPVGLGTIIRRRHSRPGYPVEGTMACVEFDPPQAIGFIINEAGIEMRGRMTITPEGPDRSRLTISVDIPGMTKYLDAKPVAASLRRIKELIEAER